MALTERVLNRNYIITINHIILENKNYLSNSTTSPIGYPNTSYKKEYFIYLYELLSSDRSRDNNTLVIAISAQHNEKHRERHDRHRKYIFLSYSTPSPIGYPNTSYKKEYFIYLYVVLS